MISDITKTSNGDPEHSTTNMTNCGQGRGLCHLYHAENQPTDNSSGLVLTTSLPTTSFDFTAGSNVISFADLKATVATATSHHQNDPNTSLTPSVSLKRTFSSIGCDSGVEAQGRIIQDRTALDTPRRAFVAPFELLEIGALDIDMESPLKWAGKRPPRRRSLTRTKKVLPLPSDKELQYDSPHGMGTEWACMPPVKKLKLTLIDKDLD